MFERLLEGMPWLAVFDDAFLCQRLFTLQLRNLLLVRSDYRSVARLNDPVEKLINLLIQCPDAAF